MRVDVGRLLNEDTLRAPAKPLELSIPTPPTPAAPEAIKAPARPAEVIQDPSRASKESIQARVEEQQQNSLVTLENRLKSIYGTRIEAFRLEQEQAQDTAKNADYAAVIERFHQLFLQYADARRPKVLQFARIVGYPDPNPTSAPPRGALSAYAQRRFEEAKQLRTDLAELDRKFDFTTATILSQLKQITNRDRAEMEARVAKFREEVNRKAAEVAGSEVRRSAKELGLRLTDPTPISLPETPARMINIPGEPPLDAPPQVPSEQISRGPAERRRLIDHELSIWLALNRYRQSVAGRDATEEFRKWRETYRGGL